MGNKIQVYRSFEEQEQAKRLYAAQLTPEQRIKEAVELIKRVYQYEDKTRINLKHIRITRS